MFEAEAHRPIAMEYSLSGYLLFSTFVKTGSRPACVNIYWAGFSFKQ